MTTALLELFEEVRGLDVILLDDVFNAVGCMSGKFLTMADHLFLPQPAFRVQRSTISS